MRQDNPMAVVYEAQALLRGVPGIYCRRCRHLRSWHMHYRDGTECSMCGCERYRLDVLEALRRRLRRDA